eukprot:Partr_v1_DN27376_c1_g1_i1_m46299 putative Vacuolar effluxer which mediate the efflux of amino acids resulting from autophagic degradation. The release of autophagic amino acids allows the maintenance of protein synthesis and viability during nitrogen starvation (By similarity)
MPRGVRSPNQSKISQMDFDSLTHTRSSSDSAEQMELKSLESPLEHSRDLSPDHPEVTKRELWSWYTYDFSSQPYASAALTIFIPLILEDLSWRVGTSDPSDPSYPACLDRANMPAGGETTGPEWNCVVPFAGAFVQPVAFSLYVGSLSVALQVISFLSLGAFADYSRWRKAFLVTFTCVVVGTCIGFLLIISPRLYWLAAILAVVGNVAYGTAMVFYNAYLPILVEAHPSIRLFKRDAADQMKKSRDELSQAEADEPHANQDTNTSSTLLDAQKNLARGLGDLTDRVTNDISTHGLAFGYSGGVIALLIFLGILLATGSTTYVMQVCVALSGIWFLAGLLTITIPRLKTRPGPPFPRSQIASSKAGVLAYVMFSWRRTWRTIKHASRLRNTFYFLISWFFYSDGFATLGSVAILFGKSELNMNNSQLMIISVTAPFFAILGNFFFLHIVRNRLGFSSKKTLIILVSLVILIPVYGMIGLVTPSNISIGIKSVAEMFVVGGVYGFLIGALQSFSRSLFSELTPPGMESEFFALYEITDRGSSWMGPLVVGALSDSLGVRYGFIGIFAILLISLPFLIFMDVDRGRIEAKEFSLND